MSVYRYTPDALAAELGAPDKGVAAALEAADAAMTHHNAVARHAAAASFEMATSCAIVGSEGRGGEQGPFLPASSGGGRFGVQAGAVQVECSRPVVA